MTFRLWPQSLFGRLMAASIIALLLAQVVSLVMIARERERFILQGSVREWSRRVVEVTTLLEGMDNTERTAMINRLTERPWRFGHRPPDAVMFRDGLVATPEANAAGAPPPPGVDDPMPPGRPRLPDGTRAPPRSDAPPGPPDETRASRRSDAPLSSPDDPRGMRRAGEPPGPTDDPRHGDAESRALRGAHRPPMPMESPREDNRSLILRATTYPAVVPFTAAGDFEPAFAEQLHKELGSTFGVEVTQTADPTRRAIPIGGPLFSDVHDSGTEFYDAKIKFPDGYTAVFRVTRYARGAPLPRGLS